jgi:hypothetical protein
MSHGAKLQLCSLSSNFWGAPCVPFIGVEVLFLVLRVGRSFNASRLLTFVYVIPVTIFSGDFFMYITNKQTPCPESASELYRPSDHRLSAKLVPTFADRGCRVVSVTNPYCRILGFLDWSRYLSFN